MVFDSGLAPSDQLALPPEADSVSGAFLFRLRSGTRYLVHWKAFSPLVLAMSK